MRNYNNKPVLILAGAIAALFAISFAVRFVALSQLGLPGGWMLMFGLPAGGIGLLILVLRLGLLNNVSHGFGVVAPVAARRRDDLPERAAGDRAPARRRSDV